MAISEGYRELGLFTEGPKTRDENAGASGRRWGSGILGHPQGSITRVPLPERMGPQNLEHPRLSAKERP